MATPSWNERYAENEFAFGDQPNDFLRENFEQMRLERGARILCLAEGEGRNAVFLAEKGFDVTAVDISDVGLAKAEKLAASKNLTIKTVVADLAEFEVTADYWNAIISIWAHVPSDLRETLYPKITRGLKRSGAFLLESYTPRQIEFATGGPTTLDLLPTLDELRRRLGGFSFEIAREIEREVHEGKYHFGQSAVVQILAFKN